MARLPRLYAPGVPHYVAQDALAGRSLCGDEADYRHLAALLVDALRTQRVALHAYVLLPDAFRLLVTPPDARALPAALQGVGRRYVPYANRRAGRSGPLWGRRYRSTLVDPDAWLLAAMQHLEQRSVVAGLVDTAAHWPWSSCRHHGGVAPDPAITDPAAYWALGNTPFERQARYRAAVEAPQPPVLVARIDDALARGWGLGDAPFVTRLEEAGARRAAPLARGRPRRSVPI